MDVLRTIDFGRTRVCYLLVETAEPDRVSELLASRFQQLKKLSFHDYLYANLEANI